MPFSLPFSYALNVKHVDDVVTVSEDAICAGMVLYGEEAKLAVEPAAAAAIAGVVGPLLERLKGKRTGVVVCGANIDAESYGRLLERGRGYVVGLEDTC